MVKSTRSLTLQTSQGGVKAQDSKSDNSFFMSPCSHKAKVLGTRTQAQETCGITE